MSALARKKRIDGPVRIKMKVASGYTPAFGDRVTVTANDLEVNKVAADTKAPGFIGEIYDPTADGDAEYCIVETTFNNAGSMSSAAAIAAPGRGVFTGQKVAAYVPGTDDATESNCVVLETASGADEEVVVIW